ncbi:MAG: DNA polymerase I [Rhizobiales bacterium]|nr:DNA polymerase I [Hyphomicrobiales bacterium]
MSRENTPQRSPATGRSDAIGPSDRLYLIDGSTYIFRAYFAMFKASQSRGRSFTRSDGTPTGAVMTFCNMLWKVVREGVDGGPATRIGVIFDHKGESFRNAIFPAYKANRDAPPEELVPQFPLIRDAVRAFGLTPIEQAGFEADDLIATYARAAAGAGASVTIVSGDKDLMQLVAPRIQMYDPMPGNERRIGEDEVVAKFGVPPSKVVEVQSLAGDATDNVPGVPGIGIKTAAQLIGEFGDLETLLAKAETIKQAKRRENLLTFAEQARISHELVRLRDDVPVETPLDALDAPHIDGRRLVAFCKAMEFRTFTNRIAEALDVVAEDIDPDPALAAARRPASGEAAATGAPAEQHAAEGEGEPAAPDQPSATAGASRATPEAGVLAGAARAAMPAIDTQAYATVTDLAELETWIAEAIECGLCAFDTETDSLDAIEARLVGVSLATAPGRACYVPLGHGAGDGLDLEGGTRVTQIPLADAIAALKPLLEHPAVLKIGQNIKYDMHVMASHGIAIAPIDDTLLISFALDAGRGGHGMDELSMRWLGHRPIAYKEVTGSGKQQVTFDKVAIDRATAYAAEDADVTLRLWHVLKPRLAAERLATVYETLERPMIPVLADMEQAGIRIDRNILAKLSGSFAQSLARLEAEIQEIAGKPFNVGSPKQLGEILFDEWKLPGGKKTKTGAWGTGADVLEDLAGNEEIGETPRRLVRTILEWRQLSKLKSTYTDALQTFINPRTKRIHTSFSLAAAGTGRLASSDPNVQNIPVRTREGREIRTAFVAERGMQLVSADYSQIELRVLAHIADIAALRQAFADGLDIHAMTASEMFGVPIEGMPSDVRRRAKAINFGIIYGISAFGLAAQLGISRSEAGDYINRYFERFPGIRDYMKSTVATARNQGYVETIFGRRIHYPDIASSNPSQRGFYERAAINAPIQGSAADIIRRAMVRMPGALGTAGLSARMLLQVHDELVFEAPTGEVPATIALVRGVMEDAPAPVISLNVPLKVDAKAAANWDEAH